MRIAGGEVQEVPLGATVSTSAWPMMVSKPTKTMVKKIPSAAAGAAALLKTPPSNSSASQRDIPMEVQYDGRTISEVVIATLGGPGPGSPTPGATGKMSTGSA